MELGYCEVDITQEMHVRRTSIQFVALSPRVDMFKVFQIYFAGQSQSPAHLCSLRLHLATVSATRHWLGFNLGVLLRQIQRRKVDSRVSPVWQVAIRRQGVRYKVNLGRYRRSRYKNTTNKVDSERRNSGQGHPFITFTNSRRSDRSGR